MATWYWSFEVSNECANGDVEHSEHFSSTLHKTATNLQACAAILKLMHWRNRGIVDLKPFSFTKFITWKTWHKSKHSNRHISISAWCIVQIKFFQIIAPSWLYRNDRSKLIFNSLCWYYSCCCRPSTKTLSVHPTLSRRRCLHHRRTLRLEGLSWPASRYWNKRPRDLFLLNLLITKVKVRTLFAWSRESWASVT